MRKSNEPTVYSADSSYWHAQNAKPRAMVEGSGYDQYS